MSWAPAQDAKLREWCASGLSAGQIAELMGVSRNAVCGRRFRLGICSPEKKSGEPFSDDETATLIAMRSDKIPYMNIARALGRSEGSLFVKASKMGITRPYRTRVSA